MSGDRHDPAVWDRAAQVYGRQEHLELQAVRHALDLLAPAPGDELLDVATGTGLVLRELAERPDAPRRAVGVDGSPGMLARVGALPAGYATQRGDATALSHRDGAFDVAVAAYLLQVLLPAQRAAALRELRRVVRPGGRVALVTPWSPRAPARAALDVLARAAPDTLRGLATNDPRAELAAAGWRLERAAFLRQGYPSLVVLAS